MLSNYNTFLMESPWIGAAKQAAVWGLSSGLATKLTGEKPKSKEEKKKELKKLGISGALGAAAGAAGTLLSRGDN